MILGATRNTRVQEDHSETKQLLRLANLSIFMIGLGFAVRASIAINIQHDLFDRLDLASSASMLSEVLGATFIGFALTLLFGSALVDRIGMKRMLILSACGYMLGSVTVAVATILPISDMTYWLVYFGLLFIGSLLAFAGLLALSGARAPLPAFFAATLWGVGVCYMWPTMLATAAERYPRGGAFLMGCMGFAGGLAIQFVLPIMGEIFDAAKLEAAGGVDALAALRGDSLQAVLRHASVESFRAIAAVPLLLAPIFAAIWLFDRARATAKV